MAESLHSTRFLTEEAGREERFSHGWRKRVEWSGTVAERRITPHCARRRTAQVLREGQPRARRLGQRHLRALGRRPGGVGRPGARVGPSFAP